MRFKHRYLLCELLLEDPRWKQHISQGTVVYNVREAVARLHGDYGAAACAVGLSECLQIWQNYNSQHARTAEGCPGMLGVVVLPHLEAPWLENAAIEVKYLNAYTGIILLRCRKEVHRLLWSSLPFITSIENRGQRYACLINTLHIGGTIRICQKFLIQYNRKQLMLLLKNCTNPEEKDAIQKSIASCTLQDVREPEEFLAEEED